MPSRKKDGVLASSAYLAVPRQDRTGAKRTGNGKRRGTLPRTGSWRGGEVPLAGLGWVLAGGWARAWNPVSSGCVRAYVMRLDAADGCLRGSCSCSCSYSSQRRRAEACQEGSKDQGFGVGMETFLEAARAIEDTGLLSVVHGRPLKLKAGERRDGLMNGWMRRDGGRDRGGSRMFKSRKQSPKPRSEL